MSLLTWDESGDVRHDHSKGITTVQCLEVADQWGDLAADHHALRVEFINIQSFSFRLVGFFIKPYYIVHTYIYEGLVFKLRFYSIISLI